MQIADEERAAFSRRLREALAQAGWKSIGPTELAREFNQRNRADRVTLHAARKWLQGEAIPTQTRVLALAQWLGVSAPWLRFGDTALRAELSTRRASSVDLHARSALMSDLEGLDAEQFWVVRELVQLMLARRRR